MSSRNGTHIAIVAGGELGDWCIPYLQNGNLFIGADRGAWFLVEKGIRPDLALGDFDSVTPVERQQIESATKQFKCCDPVDKDWTDTEWAMQEALALHPDSIVLLGATGTRFDHTLANIHLLKKAADAGIPCLVADAHNEIRLLAGGETCILSRSRFDQVSLLPLGETASGITLDGFLYPLENARLSLGQTLGISNRLVRDTGTISLQEGWLLVIQSEG